MEARQREHITAHFTSLVRCTECNDELLSILRSEGVLSNSDVEDLEIHFPSFEGSKQLYEILISRKGSFEILIKALIETKQTEAVAILSQGSNHCRSVGLISYNQNQLLGTGYAGTEVFQGTFNSTTVAVKMIPISSDSISRNVALQEIEILKCLKSHPNVILYFYAEFQVNYIYIALELCGKSLATESPWLQMDPNSILLMCTVGLEYIHKHNIIHNGLAPSKILIGLDNKVKICGFSSSVKIPRGSTFVETEFTRSCLSGMAPEVLKYFVRQNPINQRTKINISKSLDIFSLGCVFYFVLTKGRHPFGNGLFRVSDICSGKSELENSGIRNPWRITVGKMISTEPSARPTCSEIMASSCFNADSIRTYGTISFDKDKVLGSGCLGTKVFRGWIGFSDVAVKVLTGYFIKPEKALREVQILANLEPHENILRYYAAECNEDFTYIALEICQHNLQAEIKSPKLNIDPICILQQCAKGLAHLHKHHIIHRDLKPLNILLKEGGQVKICDFGLSKQIPMGKETVTVASGACGTLDWMAPEVMKHIFDREEDDTVQPIRMKTSADIFSLGCIFYYVLTNGDHPFGKGRLRQDNIYNNKSTFRIDEKFRGTPKLLELITNMIHQEPTMRPTADEIMNIVSKMTPIPM